MRSTRSISITAAVWTASAVAGCLMEPTSPAGAAQGASAASVIDASRYPDLQAAFDAVPESGGLVKLPPGRFTLSRPLLLTRDNTRVEGSGAATHLVNLNEEGKIALIVEHRDRPKEPRARIRGVQLANFRVSGNPKSGHGLLVEGLSDFHASGLSIDHHGGHGIHLIDSHGGLRVGNSFITHNAKAGLNILKSHGVVVQGNHFEANQQGLRCADGSNLTVTGNVFTGPSGQAVKAERGCRRVAVVGNVAAWPGEGKSGAPPAFDLAAAAESVVGQNAVGK